ncbi:MAG TPA: hypothetical protein VH479_19955 [Acidimicrobiales bacterium]
MLIRRELPADADAVDAVHRAAFAPGTDPGAEPVEVGLVQALRADPGWLPRRGSQPDRRAARAPGSARR